MILCEFCAWECFKEKEFKEAVKTHTYCNGCKKFKRCGWWECQEKNILENTTEEIELNLTIKQELEDEKTTKR